jgi:hypothetical protein
LVSLLDRYTVLKARFQDSAIAAMVERVGKSATAEEIDKVDLTTIAPVFVQDIAESEVGAWSALLERVDKHLKSISSAEWEEALANDNHNRQLLFARGDHLNGVIPPNHLRAPLANFVAEVMVTKDELEDEVGGHAAFWSALSSGSRKAVATDVFERIADKPVMSEGLVLAMKTFLDLFAEIPLSERPETSVSKILMPLLADDPARALQYVENAPTVWASCVEKVSAEMRSQLLEYLAGYDDAEEHQPALEGLRKHLKLRRPRKKFKGEEEEAVETEDGPTE